MAVAGAEPRLLIVETSGRMGQVALAKGTSLLAVRRLDEARRHARDLAPALADLLASLSWEPGDVDAVLVSRGPGSYTGLRIGIMSAKTFAFATGCTLLAIDTFAAIALQSPPEATRIDVLADAQQGKVYVQHYERTTEQAVPVPASPLRIEPFVDWLADPRRASAATGPGLRVYGSHLPSSMIVADPASWDPHPESLLQLGLPRFQANERDDVWSLEPLYLRASAAEQKWGSGR
jgi:tRNA threonylcarbamoyladenosine biosynthesis protein TsaB